MVKPTPLLSQRSQSSNHSSSSTYTSLYLNPLLTDKENVSPNPVAAATSVKKSCHNKTYSAPAAAALKPNSLQLCIRLDESSSSSADAWDFSDNEAAPASSWSTLPNRSLLCRPLPLDVGRCTCFIVKEPAPPGGMRGVSLYSLYTNEGQGRQDRKLAVARHRRRKGRSEFFVAQNPKGLLCYSDESFLGSVTANLMGSKYQIWDQGKARNVIRTDLKRLLGVVAFVPTITTLTGSFRSMMAWIPKQQSVQLKSTNKTQVHHIQGLPKDWEEKSTKAHQLFSREPYYNNITKRYELDFRERAGRMLPKIQTSARNFQMTMEGKGKPTLVQLGKIAKTKYVMDYRYPLTAFQAFCICLASIDSKLCCSV